MLKLHFLNVGHGHCTFIEFPSERLAMVDVNNTRSIPEEDRTALLEAHLKCDILKASHHGRYSGFHDDAVAAMSPKVVICSVGKKPETDASHKYSANGAQVFSTRYHGTITATVWNDGDIWVNSHESGERLATIES